ncbi:MAG: DUF1330 domain-containing protein [Desulfocapsaceae bacterium]
MSLFFVISTTKILDEKNYNEYVRRARPIIESYGGEYLLQSNKFVAAKDWEAEKIVIIKFGDKKQLNRCFQSPEYKEIVSLREGSIESKFVMVES